MFDLFLFSNCLVAMTEHKMVKKKKKRIRKGKLTVDNMPESFCCAGTWPAGGSNCS